MHGDMRLVQNDFNFTFGSCCDHGVPGKPQQRILVRIVLLLV